MTLRHFAYTYTHVPPVLMYSIVSRLLSFSSEEVEKREEKERKANSRERERVNRKYIEGNFGTERRMLRDEKL